MLLLTNNSSAKVAKTINIMVTELLPHIFQLQFSLHRLIAIIYQNVKISSYFANTVITTFIINYPIINVKYTFTWAILFQQ
jgi:hypothetical protein